MNSAYNLFSCEYCGLLFPHDGIEVRHVCSAVNDFTPKIGTFDENGMPELPQWNELRLTPNEVKKYQMSNLIYNIFYI